MHKLPPNHSEFTDSYIEESEKFKHADGSLECAIEGCFETRTNKRNMSQHLWRHHGKKSKNYEKNLAYRQKNPNVRIGVHLPKTPPLVWDAEKQEEVMRNLITLRVMSPRGPIEPLFKEAQEGVILEEEKWTHRKLPTDFMNEFEKRFLNEKAITVPIEYPATIDEDEILAKIDPAKILHLAAKLLGDIFNSFIEVGSKYIPIKTFGDTVKLPTIKTVEIPRLRNMDIGVFGTIGKTEAHIRNDVGDIAVNLHFFAEAVGNNLGSTVRKLDHSIFLKSNSHAAFQQVKRASPHVTYCATVGEAVKTIFQLYHGVKIQNVHN